MTPITLFPAYLRDNYEIHEWRHATAILHEDFPNQWQDIVDVLTGFVFTEYEITAPGGGLSLVSQKLARAFFERDWKEEPFQTEFTVNKKTIESDTHKVDCFKQAVALEIEWNNKDPFYSRDLNNFRLLYDLHAVSVGVIITRCDELQEIFDSLPHPDKPPGHRLGEKYGASTTHMSKLLPRLECGGAGGCPTLVFGITKKLYRPGL